MNVGFEPTEAERRHEVYEAGRVVHLPELKLLVDAIQSSKFITERKSNALIKSWRGWSVNMRLRNCRDRCMYPEE